MAIPGIDFPAVFQFRLIHKDAKAPYRKRSGDAGYDLSSVDTVEIQPGESASISTGLQISAEHGFYYTMESRSGLLKRGIVVNRAIIDSGYTGEIFVLLHNHGKESYKINVGDRITQIIPYRIEMVEFNQVNEFSDDHNSRGEDGWGSSGK